MLQKHTLALEAVERCITLFMALGNLHWFTATTCPPELKVSLFLQTLGRLCSVAVLLSMCAEHECSCIFPTHTETAKSLSPNKTRNWWGMLYA